MTKTSRFDPSAVTASEIANALVVLGIHDLRVAADAGLYNATATVHGKAIGVYSHCSAHEALVALINAVIEGRS